MDFRMDAKGEIYFLEINFTCSVFYAEGLEGSADYILMHDGTGQRGFLERIIIEGLARFQKRKNYLLSKEMQFQDTVCTRNMIFQKHNVI